MAVPHDDRDKTDHSVKSYSFRAALPCDALQKGFKVLVIACGCLIALT